MNGLLMIFLLFLLKFVYISIKIITMIVEIIFKLYAIFNWFIISLRMRLILESL